MPDRGIRPCLPGDSVVLTLPRPDALSPRDTSNHVFAAALLATLVSASVFAQGAPAAAATASSAPAAKTGKPLSPAQARMKDCSQQAKSKDLKGDARKSFMSDCLKKK